jgi:hypothetical protein
MTVKTITSEWPKQIAIWLAIATLLPFTAWFATALFWPPPDSEEHFRTSSRLNEQLGATSDEKQKQSLRVQIDKSDSEFAETEKAFARKLFWFAAPVGFVALVIGTFVRVQAVGAGLMFGAISTVTEGCYESWEALGPRIRLASLLVMLLVTIALGLLRFRPLKSVSKVAVV